MKHKLATVVLHHVFLITASILLLFPLYIALVASTHSAQALLHAPLPWLPGKELWHNYQQVLFSGIEATYGNPISHMLWHSFCMAIILAVGKVGLALLSAYAIVYFDFPFRLTSFWLIFATIMLPVQVRIVPTFEVVASLGLLNTYSGLTLPLLASATATFLFRQFFMTIPIELLEAARLDGAGPWHFFKDILLPLSRTNIVALLVVMFIYGWNEYLWPLVVTTSDHRATIVMAIERVASVADQIPHWNMVMAMAILAMLPPVIIILVMQRWFVKGFIDAEK